MFCKKVFLQHYCRCSCSIHLTLMSVRHTNLTQHPTNLQQNHYCKQCCSVIKRRGMRWVGHVACMGERWGVYRVLVAKPEGKGPFGRHRRRWDDSIKNKKTLERNLLSLFGVIFQVLAHYISFVSGHHSTETLQIFQQVAPCSKLQLISINMYCMTGPANTMDNLLHGFCILTSPASQWMTWNYQNLN